MAKPEFILLTSDQLRQTIAETLQPQLDKLSQSFQPKEPEEFMTRKEVADLLSVNLSTIHNWKKSGVLKAHSIGARVYYKRSEILESIVELEN